MPLARAQQLGGMAAVLALVAPTALAAQARSGRPVVITAGASLWHDSNVARGGLQRAATRGLSRSDERFNPNVAVSINKPFGRNLATLEGSLGYEFYRRNTVLNRERIAVTGAFQGNLSACTFTVSPTFSRRQSDLGEVVILDVPGTQAVKNTETVQSYTGRAQCGRSNGLRPFGAIERGIQDNSNVLRSRQDNRRMRYSGGVGYARPTLGELTLLAAQEEVTYPRRVLASGGRDRYKLFEAGGRFERQIGGSLRGSAQLTYATVDVDRPGAEEFSGLNYIVGLTATFADRLQIEAGLGRSVQPALQSDATYRIQNQSNVRATFVASERLSASAGAAFSSRKYEGEGSALGPPITSDRRSTYSGSLVYRLSDRMRFSGDVRYENRRAPGSFYDFSNLSEGISVNYIF